MYKRAIFRLQSWGYLFKKSTLKNKYVIFNLGQTKPIVAINKKKSMLFCADDGTRLFYEIKIDRNKRRE